MRTNAIPTKLFLIIFLALAASLSAKARLKHGTIVVFGVSRNKVIVAADSRGLEEGKPPDDHVCKISSLGGQILFTGSGIGRNEHTVLKTRNWSVFEEADRAFRKIPKSSSQSGNLVDKVSDAWLAAMKPKYAGLLKSDPTQLLDESGEVLFAAVFVAFDARGRLDARQINVTFRRSDEESGIFTPVVDGSHWDVAPQTEFKVIGHGEIAYEFAAESSPRARMEAIRWQSELLKHPGEDPDVLQAVHFVELTETYAPPEWGVGGPIDVAEILPGTGIQWIRRKPECH